MARLTRKCGSKTELDLPGINAKAVTGVDCIPPCDITVKVTNRGDCPLTVKGYEKGRALPTGYELFRTRRKKIPPPERKGDESEVTVPLDKLALATIGCEGKETDGRCRFEYAFSLAGRFRGECGGQELNHTEQATTLHRSFPVIDSRKNCFSAKEAGSFAESREINSPLRQDNGQDEKTAEPVPVAVPAVNRKP